MESSLVIKKLPIPDILLIQSKFHNDDRGSLTENFSASKLKAAGIDHGWAQDNLVWSRKGVIRGLHFQEQPGQAKLVRCVDGAIWDVAVDIRKGSPTFGNYAAIYLSGMTEASVYIPAGFAHGFYVKSEAIVYYKMSTEYNPETEMTINWDDPVLGIDWGIHLDASSNRTAVILSERDKQAKSFKEVMDQIYA